MTGRSLLLEMLEATATSYSGFEVNDRDHALQTATRAVRAGADDEVVVAALFHDAAKSVDPVRHGQVIAGMLSPHVRPEVACALLIHQDYTATHLDNGRGRWRRWLHLGRRGHRLAAKFVDEWDGPSRDPRYPTEPLAAFLPALDRVLAQRYPLPRPLVPRIRQGLARRLRRTVPDRAA
jgi:predicted HD phosphohydrolase